MSYLYPDPDRTPGRAALVFAVGLPALAILVELVTGWCAGAVFDPLPTFWHLLLVLAVPVVNLLLWMTLRSGGAGPRWLAFAGGITGVVAFTYAVLLLPILPIAAIGVILFGLGLLPFAPLVALIFAVRWTAAVAWERRIARALVGGVVAGVALTALVDLPSSIVHVAIGRYAGSEADRAGAVRLMRGFGNRDLLLRLAYGDSGRATGLVGAFASVWSHGFDDSAERPGDEARELYYRVTGEAFNARARPDTGLAARRDWFAFDRDLGGEQVGARVPGLSLAGSRIDGSAATADSLAYVEWTLDIANAAAVQNEARFTLAMPEGAVASRATLWVNGEPREASVAGRAAVRAAYRKVVTARRDPLLVITDGAGRLLVQAFPIAPGGTMRLRIGYTAPFVIGSDGHRSQALPAIVERNFEIALDARHHAWIDGATPLFRRTLSEADLIARPAFAVPRLTAASLRTGAVAGEGARQGLAVEQRIAPARGTATALAIVLDASAPMAASGTALRDALDALPRGLPVGLAIAADTPVTIAAAPWSPIQRRRFERALDGVAYVGGQDSLALLADAAAGVAQPGGHMLWIHGAQPVDVARSRTALDQLLARATVLPRLIRYQPVGARATTITGKPLFEQARMVTPTGRAGEDIRTIFAGLTGPVWATGYRRIARAPTGSSHLVRLWAARALAGAGKATGPARDAQIARARALNLITPVSGAVVLETDRDYRDNDLPVPSADDVPTIPEPETWALLAILALAGVWVLRQRHRPLRAVAL